MASTKTFSPPEVSAMILAKLKADAEAKLGEKIGHIRVTEFLAKGGMGDVYAGYDEKLGRRVALKAIRSEHRLDAEAKARFLREARILSQLEHPRICRIHDLLEEDDAERFAVQRRRAEHVGAPHAGRHVVVAEPAEPLDAGVPAVPGAQRLGLRAGAPDPHHDVGREVA